MTLLSVKCDYCNKIFPRSLRQVNEARKLGWKTYCSNSCISKARNFQMTLVCSRSGCDKVFKRRKNQYLIVQSVYCSRSCAAIVNNSKFPKNPGVIKQCYYCGKNFVSREKFCSKTCKDKSMIIPENELINEIKNFVKINGRIPLKSEFAHTKAARDRFGTWNNAIKAAGFDPNPVMFAKKHISKDGHRCDSLAEKIIDDWMYARKIIHERSVRYPGKDKLTVDFLVNGYWVEFFGLHGQHKRYDELRQLKLKVAQKFKLKLLEIYPKDLFPENKLEKVLSIFII